MDKYLRPQEFESEIANTVGQFSSQPIEFVFTGDVARWATSKALAVVGNPIATSFPALGQAPCRIVMQDPISYDELQGAIGRLEIRGEWALGSRFRREPKAFVLHLALHELAHIENNWAQDREDDCDAWALARLP